MLSDVTLVVELIVGLLFLQASLSKGVAPRAFAEGLDKLELGIAAHYLYPTAVCVIVVEGFIAVAYLTGWLLSTAAAVSVGLMLVFVSVNAVVLWRGSTVSCLCFSVTDSEIISWRTLSRAATLFAATMFVWGQVVRGHWWPVPHELGSAVLLPVGLALMTLTCAMWIYRVPELIALRKRCIACEKHARQPSFGNTPVLE